MRPNAILAGCAGDASGAGGGGGGIEKPPINAGALFIIINWNIVEISANPIDICTAGAGGGGGSGGACAGDGAGGGDLISSRLTDKSKAISTGGAFKRRSRCNLEKQKKIKTNVAFFYLM